MTVGSLNAINATLGAGRLQDDERLVLAALVKAGFDEAARPKGHDGRLTSNALAAQVYPLLWESASPNWNEERSRIDTCKRRVRKAVNSLIIKHGIPIMCEAGYGGGYYLPSTEADVEHNHERFHKRAMTGLVKASRSRKSAYADSIVQLTLGFEDEARRLEASGAIPGGDDAGPPAWVSVVTSLLNRVKGDPVKFASEIRLIQNEFGDIFVRRDKVAKIRELSSELNRVLEGLNA